MLVTHQANRYIVTLFSWIGIWTLLIIGMIWLIDPYGVSPFKVTLNGINLYKPARLDIDRLIKPLEVWRYQPKTIFIGTSRIQQSFDPSVFEDTEFAPAYNAAIPASNLMANADNIELFLKLNPHIKHIFIELFFYNFTHLSLESTPHTWNQILHNVASLEVSTDAFRDALKTVYINHLIRQGKEPRPAFIAEGGYRIPKEDFNPAETFNSALFIHTVSSWDHTAHLTLDNSAFKPLDRIVSLAQRHGVKLHLIITPNYPWDDYRLLTLGYWPLLEKWLRKLATYPNVTSFSQYNTLLEEAPTHKPRMKWWNDPIHFSLNMGRSLLSTYLEPHTLNLPKNFRRDLNTKTVETVIAERRDGLFRWTARHPDFVMDFADAKLVTDSLSGNLDPKTNSLFINGNKYFLALGEGEVAFANKTMNTLSVSGWTVDEIAKRPPSFIIATKGNVIVAQGYTSTKRPDLALSFNNKELNTWFTIDIPFSKGPPDEPIRIFALMHDGRAVQLVSESKLIDGVTIARPLGTVRKNELIIGKKIYPISNYYAGSIEKRIHTPSGQSDRIIGSAFDLKNRTAVLALFAARDSEVVAKSVPTILKKQLTGFSMLVPLDKNTTHIQKKIHIFALMRDGHVAPLKNSI